MSDFVDCDLGETERENESIDIFDFDEPPAKKKRGANVKYDYLEIAESSDDLKGKAKNAGLTSDKEQGENVYFKCKTAKCCYKWKARRTNDIKYLIYETQAGHNHGNAESKAGLTHVMRDIVDKRMKGNEKINAGAIIQAIAPALIFSIAAHDLKRVTKVIFSGETWYVRRSKSRWNDVDSRDYLEYYNDRDNDLDAADIMPALRQTINGTARNRPGRPKNHAPALSRN